MWFKAYLHADHGLSIGKDDEEQVFFNTNTGLLLLEREPGKPYISTLDSYSNYRLMFFGGEVVAKIKAEAKLNDPVKQLPVEEEKTKRTRGKK